MSATNPLGVPAHQHPNGGGWVADTAYVAESVYVGPAARIYGGTIRGGTVLGGFIRGGTILGGTIRGGTIRGGTIWGGTIEGGIIEGGIIEGGTIEGGTIEGGIIRGGTIRGGTIEGGTIEGGTIRHSRHVLTIGPIGSQDQYATLTHTDDGHLLSIGCWQYGTIDQLAAEVQRRCPEYADEYAEIEAILRRRIAEWDAEREAAS